jgi:hypothetical protein
MRVTKPDFWESEDIGNLSFFGRLLLKAVWSYVDDNGVQKDSAVGIAAECFRHDLARDPVSTLKVIEGGMDELHEMGFIIRYAVRDERYIEAADWDFWQKPKNPSKPRYPTSNDPHAEIAVWTEPVFSDESVGVSPLDATSGSVSGSVSGKEDRRRLYGGSTETLRSCWSCGGSGPFSLKTGLCLPCSAKTGEKP